MKELNILVADNHPIFVEGVKTVLAQADDTVYFYKVQNVARSAQQLQFMLDKHPVDLLLLDPAMPEALAIDTLPSLKRLFSGLRVLIVTDHNDPQLVKAAMKAGADGYLLKTSTKDELLSAIQEVSEGNTYLGFGVASNGGSSRQNEESSILERNFAKKHQLTRREIEIIRHIGQAMTNREIGEKLYISDQTVSVHRKNIMRKLRVNSTASLIKIVFENHLENPLN